MIIKKSVNFIVLKENIEKKKKTNKTIFLYFNVQLAFIKLR